jgi:hypothetical protein
VLGLQAGESAIARLMIYCVVNVIAELKLCPCFAQLLIGMQDLAQADNLLVCCLLYVSLNTILTLSPLAT